MENYILSFGIRGSLFTKPFTRGSDEAEREACEIFRQRLMAPLVRLRSGFTRETDTHAALILLYDYLRETQLADSLSRLSLLQERDGLPDKAVQTAQMYDTLIALMEQVDSLLSAVHCTPQELADRLEAGLAARELSALPPTADCVSCGSIGNLPLYGKKAVFASGLCDTLLSPAAPQLLNDREKEAL